MSPNLKVKRIGKVSHVHAFNAYMQGGGIAPLILKPRHQM
jgi:hypothetical protein